VAEAHIALGEVDVAEGDLREAQAHFVVALEAAQGARNILAECSARTRFATLRLAQGR
jgi:hypothetical protein